MAGGSITYAIPQTELLTVAQQCTLGGLLTEGWKPLYLELRDSGSGVRSLLVVERTRDKVRQRARVLHDGVLLYTIPGGKACLLK